MVQVAADALLFGAHRRRDMFAVHVACEQHHLHCGFVVPQLAGEQVAVGHHWFASARWFRRIVRLVAVPQNLSDDLDYFAAFFGEKREAFGLRWSELVEVFHRKKEVEPVVTANGVTSGVLDWALSSPLADLSVQRHWLYFLIRADPLRPLVNTVRDFAAVAATLLAV